MSSGLCPGRLRGTGGARGTGGTIGPCPDLCTVCEATRKDMRSPGESSSPAIREPPTKMVPRTMPVGWGQSWDLKGTRRRGIWRRSCPRESHPIATEVPLRGPRSPLSARLESPWKAAMPSPSCSLRCPARSTSAENSLGQGWVGVPASTPPTSPSPLPSSYPACCSSMAKARTVRTLPRASSATTVALATCRGRGDSGDTPCRGLGGGRTGGLR